MLTFPAPTFREWSGPLTEDLVRDPARFGLGQLPRRLQPNGTAKSICGFCSTGCGLKLHLRDGVAINATPDPDYPVNLGTACPKGWEALTVLDAADRATTPLIHGKPADWKTAMQVFCDRMKAVLKTHGPESAAFISTGQIMSEEMAYLGSLAKFGMGLLHGDGNTRQCMATAVMAYKESFGFDSPPFTYGDYEESDVMVFIGANPCIAHPIMWQRVLRNKRNPQIIVVDPRVTETAMAATQHYAIQPKSDLTLLYGIAHLLIRDGAVDTAYVEQHTTGYAEFAAFVQSYSPESVACETGLSVDQLQRFADTIRTGTPRVSFWWTMGVNQSHQATRTAQAIINLALMTGNIGKPGTGANSITGQCNAMGSRLFSNTTNLIGGHDFKNETHRAKVAEATGFPLSSIPDRPSLAYDQILQGIESGKIKALWVIATNPAHSWINQNRFNELVKKLDFFVVQDMYHSTETARQAHLFLPAAAWGEKEGTFINSERRIGVSRPVRHAPGQALSDFRIFRLIAQAWGVGEMFKEWTTPEAVFQVLKRCSKNQPCEITGIRDYAMIEASGGIQWPLKAAASATEAQPDFAQQRRLFEDGRFFTPDQKARFIFDPPQAAPEAPDADYPLVLLTGRGTSAQWHTESRTGKSEVLRKLAPSEPHVELHPDDARRLKIKDAEEVVVESRRGKIRLRVRHSTGVQPGQVFLAMHDSRANQLTLEVVDPHSRQPSYKYCAVRVLPGHEQR